MIKIINNFDYSNSIDFIMNYNLFSKNNIRIQNFVEHIKKTIFFIYKQKTFFLMKMEIDLKKD